MQLVLVQLQIVEGKNDPLENYPRFSDGNVSIANIIPGIFKSKSQRVKVSDIRNTIIPIPRHVTVWLRHQCRVISFPKELHVQFVSSSHPVKFKKQKRRRR